MPELPEVERVRLTLAQQVLGRKVQRVQLLRADVVHPPTALEKGADPHVPPHTHMPPATPAELLAGRRLARLDRHGKQLTLIADDGRCVCIHLGMTGSLQWHSPASDSSPSPPDARRAARGADPADPSPHTHLIWCLDDGSAIHFRDPRRFGGLWTFPTVETMHAQRWHRLGSDALTITPTGLHQRLRTTRRPLKAALLDQHIIAGLGNIYVDELLFALGLHPARAADTLALNEVQALVRRMRTLLHRAIAAGGSTLRDYVDGNGSRGNFQKRHQVYGRAGQPCQRCHQTLTATPIAGRTTVLCTSCQR